MLGFTSRCLVFGEIDIMEILESGCLVILGRTNSGRVSRPSDWDQRLCCSVSKFEDGRLTYSKYVRPIHKDKDKGVFIAAELKKEDPELWDFVVNFAKDNDLVIEWPEVCILPETSAA